MIKKIAAFALVLVLIFSIAVAVFTQNMQPKVYYITIDPNRVCLYPPPDTTAVPTEESLTQVRQSVRATLPITWQRERMRTL